MKQAFTLIELLIVIMIIGVLSTITLQLNRGQIKEMEAMNEKEQRLSRHRTQNNIITNTNFINKQKINTGIEFIYKDKSSSIFENISGTIIEYPLKNYKISGDLIITKTPLSLGCTTSKPNKIEFIGPGATKTKQTTCFTINTHLCSREACK